MLTDLHELLMLHQLDRQEQPGKLDQKEQQFSQNQVQKASELGKQKSSYQELQ